MESWREMQYGETLVNSNTGDEAAGAEALRLGVEKLQDIVLSKAADDPDATESGKLLTLPVDIDNPYNPPPEPEPKGLTLEEAKREAAANNLKAENERIDRYNQIYYDYYENQ
jgi:hypothetical protein